MTKEELLEVEGVVTALLPNLMSRVLLDNGQEILATSSGRLRRNRIRLLVGDRVTVEMSQYDLSKGRINYRHKDAGTAAAPSPHPVRAAAPAPLEGAAGTRHWRRTKMDLAAKLPEMEDAALAVLRENAGRLEQTGTAAQKAAAAALMPALDAELEKRRAAKLEAARNKRAATKRAAKSNA